MNIKFLATRWGNNQPWDIFFERLLADGFDGLEFAFPLDVDRAELDLLHNLCRKHNIGVIAQHYSTYDADFNLHYDNYIKWFEMISPYPWMRVSTQTGKDYFTFEQNKALIDFTVEYEQKYSMPVSHETHRNKFNFAAHITKQYLEKINYLRLTLDISHWVNVAESYLQDQQEAVDLAISRTDHIHARVGYPEGPQISDPRAPEWQEALDHHLAWWDKIVATKRAEDAEELTILPEFGPHPYMIHLPYTQQPIADQWEVNKFMKGLLKERYLS
ncbi:sugar phosphate isomerase/epimerase [Mucilaginibacter limnophilus]|uniref:Sugar phosphate isomerase/epimerase n=1 Tax=Mucilaginibacter limnophilus TaxID=1932778 RepID=A0A437MQC8_9SPHI|nr:sugar phosphate isomerase/epimerase [Mucilaginibacter limnophilus]RVT99856.1 sugar phosphate isomerase/epimerase [Mucilaginibacter limnophilus]